VLIVKSDTTIEITQAPGDLNCVEAESLLRDLEGVSSIAARISKISQRFLGRPYVEAPLGGGVDRREVFSASLDGFDCVTYIESVLAFAVSRTLDEFIDSLRKIRYAEGTIGWFSRNHYMIDWARNNDAAGFVSNMTTGEHTVERTCHLNLVPGLPSRTETFSYFPKSNLGDLWVPIETADLALFVSERETLDVFHTGIFIKHHNEVLMRHATRTAGSVIEQPLVDFLNNNKLAGLILLRPLCHR